MYIDPAHTAVCIGATLHWCNRLMSKRNFLELITTILDPSVWVVDDDDDIHWMTQKFASISYLCMRLLDEIDDEIIRDIVINIVMDTNHPLSLIKSLSGEKSDIYMPLNGKLYFLKICSQVMGFSNRLMVALHERGFDDFAVRTLSTRNASRWTLPEPHCL